MKTQTHKSSLVAAVKSRKTNFLVIVFLCFIVPKVGHTQWWQIENWSDCNLTVTLSCGSTNQTSNTYNDSWPGSWSSSSTHVFNSISCNCSNPQISIVDECQDPPVPIYSGPINGLPSENGPGVCCCGHDYPDCTFGNG